MADFPYFPTIGTNVCIYPQSGCATYTDSVHRLVLFGGDVLRRVLCVLVPPPIEEIGQAVLFSLQPSVYMSFSTSFIARTQVLFYSI